MFLQWILWAVKVEHKVRLDGNEVSMIRWTCGFMWNTGEKCRV